MEGEEREEERDKERKGEIDRYGEKESEFVWGAAIDRKRRGDGGRYRYKWRGERWKNFLALDALISAWMMIFNPILLLSLDVLISV